MDEKNNFEDESGFWASVFRFGKKLLFRGEVARAQWDGNYQDYINSPAWKRKSKEAKERAGNRCQLCNSQVNLQTHHRTYERLGDEDAIDLIVLCKKCHAKFHGVI